jgi:hypothetical protein
MDEETMVTTTAKIDELGGYIDHATMSMMYTYYCAVWY